MSLPRFELQRPDRLDEALAARSEDALPVCGGTELLLAMKMGLLRPQRLIDLKRIPDLRTIERDTDTLRIGAAATHDSIARSHDVRGGTPMLAQVAERVGNPRVRMQGTIGGNVAFAEPKSDVTAALAALEARVELRSSSGARELTIEELIQGPYWTDIADDELLTEIRVPIVEGRRAVYEKFQTMERPTVGVAVRADPDGAARLVIAAVGGEPHIIDVAAVDDLDAAAIAADVDVTPDLTGGERYKRHLVAVTISRAVERLRELGHG